MESSCAQTAKRVRRANYSQQEKDTLLTIVNKYKHIIENKKTDSVTNQEDRTKISNEFNSVAPGNTFRDAQSLKKSYNNIKMQVRKEAADEKVQYFKTGGGGKSRGNPDNDGLRELALDTMNNKTVFGLTNLYDSDGVVNDGVANTASSSVLNDILVYEGTEDDIIFLNSQEDDDVALENINKENEEGVPKTSTLTLTSKMKPTDLKLPLHPSLANKIQNTVCGGKKSEVEKPNWTGRRRPNGGVALHSTELGKIYHQLGQERLEIAQKENLLMQKKLEHEDEIHKLKCDILKAELRQKYKE